MTDDRCQMCMSRRDLGNLNSHLTNTCHMQRSNGVVSEKDAVKLLSELPQVESLPLTRLR